ncbi:MAG: peptidoglycan D,D-transpeptidase FtsI family protein, partial [Planctomycetota bacterium]
ELPRFVVITKDLHDGQVEAFADARAAAGPFGVLRGAHLQSRPVRLRPFGEMADSLVGKTFPDGKGMTGVEQRANAQLAATPGRTIYFATNRGHMISVPADGHMAGAPGTDIRLAIDMVVQEILERELEATVRQSNAGGARGVVVDVQTGEILAVHDILRNTGRSAVAKDELAAIDPAAARLRWMTDPFEPGSIFKPFVWAWAIEKGFAKASDRIVLPDGPLTIGDGRARRTINEAHPSSYGSKTWRECLTKSVNAGMATVALKMPAKELQECLRQFGFGIKTGIGLNYESPGILPPAEEWKHRTRAQVSVSFGQGIAVTPLQLVHAFTSFCRDGSMVPLSIAPIPDDALTGFETVMSERSSMLTREVMQEVITDGTGKKLKDILHYTAFGKSGTAQLVKSKEQGGGYFDDRYVSSFLLGAPFEHPELAILVTIEDPDKTKGPHGGGALAGPCAARVMNDALKYLGVPTEGELVYAAKKDEKKKLAAQ